jgi:subtilisin family serine protease
MKLASLIASLVLLASFAQAKDRYLVQFKSERGYKAMETYFNSTESSSGLQRSLKNTHSIVLKTKNAKLIESLKNHPEVESVEAERFFPVPKPINGFKVARVRHFESAFRKNKVKFEGETDGEPLTAPEFQAGPATPWGITAVHAGAAWAQSSAGAKARVLVLDTGIDAEHPAISPNFEKGRNFTESASGGVIESDYNDAEGHGTHCAGTILGAYNAETGFTGVAPKSKLLVGKVCSAEGCSSIAIVEGINWGIQEKVDVISMSLGGPFGANAERQAVTKADKAGVVVVAASGNGADDPSYSPNKADPKCGGAGNPFQPNMCGVSFPAAFPSVVAVGALDSTLAKTGFSQWGPELDVTAPGAAVVSSVPRGSGRDSKVELTLNGETKLVNSSAFGGTELFATPAVNELVVVPGVGKPEDFAGVNVEGKFALISRGEIKFADKVKNAIEAKAVGVIIYNNKPGLMQGSLSEDGSLIAFPVVMVEQTTGAAIVDEVTKGTTVSASISTRASDYASFDGTSMATPHVAGVVALIRSANKSLTPSQVRAILTSTATALSPNDTNQFGAGIVQADAAVQKAVAP